MSKDVKIIDANACYITLEIKRKKHKVPTNGYNSVSWWMDYLKKKVNEESDKC